MPCVAYKNLGKISMPKWTKMRLFWVQVLSPLFRKRVQTNGEMKVLDFSQMELNFEGVILQDLSDFAFGKMPFGEFGEIAVPVYC